MFVPGVNGSVIPSVSSGSKLKSAYKNSKNLKKRKMPNGGIELALDAASFAPPPVGTVGSSPYNNTMRVPQRDNTQVQFRPNPNLRRMEEGGEVEDDDDKEMVDGVASILRGVKDKKNRLQLANKLAKQFNREKVKYSLPEFLKKSKVKK